MNQSVVPVPLTGAEESALLEAFAALPVEQRGREMMRLQALAATSQPGAAPPLPVAPTSRAAVGRALVLELEALTREAEAHRRYDLARRLGWLAVRLGEHNDGATALSSIEAQVLRRFGRPDLTSASGVLYHALAIDLGINIHIVKTACEALAQRGYLLQSGTHGARFELPRLASHPFLVEIQHGAASPETFLLDEIEDVEMLMDGAREVGAIVRVCHVLKVVPA